MLFRLLLADVDLLPRLTTDRFGFGATAGGVAFRRAPPDRMTMAGEDFGEFRGDECCCDLCDV